MLISYTSRFASFSAPGAKSNLTYKNDISDNYCIIHTVHNATQLVVGKIKFHLPKELDTVHIVAKNSTVLNTSP